MRTDVFVDSDGIAVITITQPGDNVLTESQHKIAMHMSEASALAEQIKDAVRSFPGSPEDSPAWSYDAEEIRQDWAKKAQQAHARAEKAEAERDRYREAIELHRERWQEYAGDEADNPRPTDAALWEALDG